MLIPFWFRTNQGLGYGVTAVSEADAVQLLRSFGYPREDEELLEVVPHVRSADLDPNHVVPNAGPIVIRGIWFPMHNV